MNPDPSNPDPSDPDPRDPDPRDPDPRDPDQPMPTAPMPSDPRLDHLLQRAREHRAPADLWQRIEVRARVRTRRPGRWLASAAALLLGGVGYWLAAAALRPSHAPRPDGVHAVVSASWPFLRGADPGGVPAAEQRLLQQLAAGAPAGSAPKTTPRNK